MENRTFEKTLPDGYKEVYCVDAQNKKLITILTIGNFIITIAIITAAGFIIKPRGFFMALSPSTTFIFIALMFAYIVLHELVHGIAYKIMTHEKLTFGFTLTVAYCGVPNIYVYRRTALISLIAPFAVFSVIFLGLVFLLPNPAFKFLAVILFAVHVGGCIGDLYDTFLFLTKLKNPEILMNDTGPKQTFYEKVNNY